MNKIRLNRQFTWIGLLLSVVLFVILWRPVAAQEAKPYDQLEFPPLPEITVPDYERYELSNGMVVYLMEDHDLPLVKGNAIIRTGSRWEDADHAGLAEIVATALRTGGTQSYSPDQVNEILENQAASIETAMGDSSATASFDTLSEDFDTVFNLFAEVLRYPTFNTDKIALAIAQQEGAIARRNDDPNQVARREFEKLVYGETSPYVRIPEYQTLTNISPDDVVEFYRQYFYPDQLILGIVGDFDPETTKELIESNFGDWQPRTQSLGEPPAAQQQYEDGIFIANLPQLSQSNVLLGHIGGQLDSPDYPALTVMNGVLNGFGGRLFNKVRSKQGLAYSVYGVWSAEYDYPGMFIAGGQTRSETTVPFVESILEEIEDLRNNPITPAELAYAKDSILNSFVFNFQSPEQTLSRLMRYEYYGYPEDFIFTYEQAVKDTTVEDVQRVAQTHLAPDKIVTLVVGNESSIQPPLSSLGSVITVDISIGSPQSS